MSPKQISGQPKVREPSTLYERIYARAAQVPPGYVTTYGTIGKLIGCPARAVGYAMHFLSAADRPEVPWQRVINVRGGISTHGERQRQLLEAEGVVFNEQGLVDLQRYGWQFADAAHSVDLSDLAEI